MMQQVSFRRMYEGNATDYQLLNRLEDDFARDLPDRILAALQNLEQSLVGYQVSRLEHSLQSATRAERDGADIEMIVAALIHDLGDVRSEVTWIIEHHGVFQMYYYGDAMGVDKNAREIYRDHKWFDSCERFCGRWDQMSFDPHYQSLRLDHFAPMVREIFTRPPFDPSIIGNEV
jgi:predicted HD phosphohydrolase